MDFGLFLREGEALTAVWGDRNANRFHEPIDVIIVAGRLKELLPQDTHIYRINSEPCYGVISYHGGAVIRAVRDLARGQRTHAENFKL